jgi:hypothetical protein
MSHASSNAQRLFTRAANTNAPGKRSRLLRLAKQWAARAVETDAERDARVEGEHQRQEALRIQRIDLAARHIEDAERARIWAARQAERYAHETPEQRADRIENETRKWRDRHAARVARGIKYGRKDKKDGKIKRDLDEMRTAPPDKRNRRIEARRMKREMRAVKQREREAKQEAKRVASRCVRPRALPPFPILPPPLPF